MKTFTVALSKPGHAATATVRYRVATWPDRVEWEGDRGAFKLSDGSLIPLQASLGWFERTVAHQAAQAGAEYQIADDGGSAPMETDMLADE